jgi:hypothetical protein
MGTAVAQWFRSVLQIRRSLVRFQMASLDFSVDIILPIALWPWGQLILQQKWVPGVFPGGKGGRCVRLTTLSPCCAVVKKSGNLNFLEPSGPFQASNGTALPLHTALKYVVSALSILVTSTLTLFVPCVLIELNHSWHQRMHLWYIYVQSDMAPTRFGIK